MRPTLTTCQPGKLHDNLQTLVCPAQHPRTLCISDSFEQDESCDSVEGASVDQASSSVVSDSFEQDEKDQPPISSWPRDPRVQLLTVLVMGIILSMSSHGDLYRYMTTAVIVLLSAHLSGSKRGTCYHEAKGNVSACPEPVSRSFSETRSEFGSGSGPEICPEPCSANDLAPGSVIGTDPGLEHVKEHSSVTGCSVTCTDIGSQGSSETGSDSETASVSESRNSKPDSEIGSEPSPETSESFDFELSATSSPTNHTPRLARKKRAGRTRRGKLHRRRYHTSDNPKGKARNV